MRFLLLAALLMFGTPLPATGQGAATSIQQTSPNQPDDAAKEQEIALLKSEIALTKSFQESLLATVYWGLGGTFIIAGLLLGFGWYANFRVYERDKMAIRAELEAIILGKLSEIELSLNEKASAIPDLVAVRTKEASEKAVKSTNDSVSALSRKVFSLEYRHLKTKMESNPSNNMALTDALRLLQLCLKKAPNEIPDIMHFMLKKIDLGGKLTATEITELNEALDLLPSHYSTLTEKLRAKLIASDIF